VVARITAEQRRTRLGVRHRLAPDHRATTAPEVADSLVALHATDPSTVVVSALARMTDPATAAVTTALYDDRSLVRMLGMRRTLWVVTTDVAPVVQASSSRAVAGTERRRISRVLVEAGVTDDPEAWLAKVTAAAVAALAGRGEATAAELATDVPELRTRITARFGAAAGAEVNLTSQLMVLMGVDGLIVRGQPRGSWNSTQHRWAILEEWLPAPWDEWALQEAQTELARRWLASFGPGQVADLKWWTGWTAGEVKRALGHLDIVEVDLDGAPGIVLAADLEEPEPPGPWAALLPALDPTGMGWAARDWYLGPYREALFDRSGNIGPTVWWNGRIVGGWAHRPSEVVYRLLEDIGKAGQAAVEQAAARLADAVAPVVVTPRFRTPLERELSG
jgi:winged helix DNA-binding protein